MVVRYFLVFAAERRVTRQKSVKAKSDQPKATKSLGARYAELLRLREAVARTQAELMHASSNVARTVRKGERALSYH